MLKYNNKLSAKDMYSISPLLQSSIVAYLYTLLLRNVFMLESVPSTVMFSWNFLLWNETFTWAPGASHMSLDVYLYPNLTKILPVLFTVAEPVPSSDNSMVISFPSGRYNTGFSFRLPSVIFRVITDLSAFGEQAATIINNSRYTATNILFMADYFSTF